MPSRKRGYHFSDIHFGKKSNSAIHNQDCLDYLEWFCQQVRNDPNVDYVAFLGDWHESRNAIDISTLKYSYEGASMLNQLGLPVYFLVGNHDMGMRHSRELYSTVPFHEFENFILIHNEPYVCDQIEGGALFVPFLTKDEYPSLNKYTDIPMWAGHFEFQGFVLTGYSVKLEHGPDIGEFKDVTNILSGHFHRRQSRNNTTYIGNTFPMDFGDANDVERGYAIYDHTDHTMSFVDWPDVPCYIKCTLSQIVDKQVILRDKCHLNVDIDFEINYQQLNALEDSMRTKYNVRSILLDESSKFIVENHEAEHTEIDNDHRMTNDDIIITSLRETDQTKFDVDLLEQLYREA